MTGLSSMLYQSHQCFNIELNVNANTLQEPDKACMFILASVINLMPGEVVNKIKVPINILGLASYLPISACYY